ATDVTGFGLLGHLHNMLAASGLAAEIVAASVPLFPNAVGLAERGAIPGGTTRNRDALASEVEFAVQVPEPIRVLLFDAQAAGSAAASWHRICRGGSAPRDEWTRRHTGWPASHDRRAAHVPAARPGELRGAPLSTAIPLCSRACWWVWTAAPTPTKRWSRPSI